MDTETVSQADTVIQTTQERVKEIVINTYEKKKVDITCFRQTVSHMEVVSVEEQLIQVFCEQVSHIHSARVFYALISTARSDPLVACTTAGRNQAVQGDRLQGADRAQGARG